MSGGIKWKIRPEEKWEDDIAPGAVEGEFEDAGDGNFKVSEAGNYTIKWYFNKVPKIIAVKTNKTTLFSFLYIASVKKFYRKLLLMQYKLKVLTKN